MKHRIISLTLAAVFAACQWLIGGGSSIISAPAYSPQSVVLSGQLSLGGEQFARGEVSGLEHSDGRLLAGKSTEGTFTSAVLVAPLAFTDLGLIWRGTFPPGSSLTMEVRTSADGVGWSAWRPVVPIDDLPSPGHLEGAVAGRLISTPAQEGRHRLAQCRATLRGTEPGSTGSPDAIASLDGIDVVFIDASEGPTAAAAARSAAIERESLASQGTGRPPIISRVSWGCPEGGSSPGWPPEYRPLKAFIIHHTVDSFSADYAARVRAMWYYHARTLGWGDIGYNYLIDPIGNIYEGRAGGDDVVGGHALRYNYGSLGVAVLGNYEQSQPTGASLAALTDLLAWKADQKAIDPRVMSSYFIDRYLPTLMGHRDAISNTTCPGQYLQQALPGLRQRTYDQVSGNGAAAQITAFSVSPTSLRVGDALRVSIAVRNSGSATLYTQEPTPGYTYQEGERATSGEFGRVRVGVGFSGSGGADYPYRWGLGTPLAPGASTTVTGYVRVRNASILEYFARTAREQIGYISAESGRVSVRVSPPDTTPPVSQVVWLPPFVGARSFLVSWSGSDEAGGSGLDSFDVQYRVDTGPWIDWKVATAQSSAVFGPTDPVAVESGKTYYFRSRARDRAGNVGVYRTGDGDTHATVDLIPPSSTVRVEPDPPTHTWFTLYWTGQDVEPGSGVGSYDVDVSMDGLAWKPWLQRAEPHMGLYLGEAGARYYFRVRARDRAGNLEVSEQADLAVVAGDDPSGLSRLWFPSLPGGQ